MGKGRETDVGTAGPSAEFPLNFGVRRRRKSGSAAGTSFKPFGAGEWRAALCRGPHASDLRGKAEAPKPCRGLNAVGAPSGVRSQPEPRESRPGRGAGRTYLGALALLEGKEGANLALHRQRPGEQCLTRENEGIRVGPWGPGSAY